MYITEDGAEIETANEMRVHGEWVRFTDEHGAVIKIDPYVVKRLHAFVLKHASEFEGQE